MTAAWHFLIANGLIRCLIGWTVGYMMGAVLVPRVKAGVRELTEHLKLIAERLDPNTPGGLGDLPGVRDDRSDSRDS